MFTFAKNKPTVSEIMESPEANHIGWLSFILTMFVGAWNWITENGNEAIVICSGLLGIVFLFFKIKLTITEYKIKQKELKKLNEHELKN